jgi:biotin carboxyl carrier protein
VPSELVRIELATEQRTLVVGYGLRRGGAIVEVDGARVADLVVRRVQPDLVVLEHGSVQRSFSVHRVGDVAFVDGPLGSSAFTELPRYPSAEAALVAGSLVAPMPGIVLRVCVVVGDAVAARAELLVLEAMKMEHRILAPAAGTVTALHVAPGDNVAAGALLVVIADGDTPGENGNG